MSSVTVQIDSDLFNAASIEGKENNFSASEQIILWAKVGRNALANPDLPISFIYETLIAKNQEKIPFEFEE